MRKTLNQKNYNIPGPNTGFEFWQRYECIKFFEHHKRQKILQTDRSVKFWFTFSIDKYAFL